MNSNTVRKKNLKLNTISSLGYQLVNIVCNFILPRLILETYGSDVNGLINSITQFLHVIGFLELGVGAVVQSSLYKPLAERNHTLTSKVIASANKFFRRIAYVLIAYIAVLLCGYPYIAEQDFGWTYTALLIVAIGISSFAQYCFGIVDSLLLTADQRAYIQYITRIITIVLNTVACAGLIYAGAGIHTVKLTTSVFFLLRPLVLRIYISKHYCIDRKIKYNEEPIKQKWNGIAQHIAAVVLDGTDVVVLTLFSTLSDVSIYSVYHLVINGIKSLFTSLVNGIKSLIGELWAKQELKSLNKTFGWFEWLLHTGTVYVFGCAGVLIVPFVSVYTNSINDANYIQPIFAALITLAHACHCLRLPYSIMILAGGHYKQTQSNYIVAAIINIVISIITVVFWGLIGVAIGTLAAMLYQTIWMAHYVSKNLNKWPFRKFAKQIVIDVTTTALAVIATCWLKLNSIDYISWIWLAVKVASIWLVIVVLINLVFYPERVLGLFNSLSFRKRKNDACKKT